MSTSADIAAYNERRRRLAEKGIDVPDRHDQDAPDDESDPTGALPYRRRVAAENDAEREAARERGKN